MDTLGTYDEIEPLRNRQTLLWLSAGGCYVLDGEWIPLVQRSAHSQSNPGKVTVSSGRSDSTAELYEPALVFRELFEEIAILTAEGKLLIPDLHGGPEGWTAYTPEWIERHLGPMLRVTGVVFQGVELAPATVDHNVCTDRVEVWRAGRLASRTSCLIDHVPDRSDVNLLCAVSIELGGRSLQSLRFFDLESAVMDGVVIPLRRDIYLFHIPSRKLFANRVGWYDRRFPVDVELTSHATALLDRICEARERATDR